VSERAYRLIDIRVRRKKSIYLRERKYIYISENIG
jgi:hypothetical protein